MTDRRPRPIEISPQKAEELVNLLRIASEESMGAHLSDDQFIDYVVGDLSGEEMLQIDQHLELCEDCGTQIEHLATNAMAWNGANGRRRLKELRKRILNHLAGQTAPAASFLGELALQIRKLLLGTNLIPGMVQAATEEKKYFQQGDQWSCYLDLDKRGNYILRISSHDMTLEGTQLRLHSKDWQREVTLVRVDPNQIGAKVVLTPEDIAKFPVEHDFSIELIRQDIEPE